MDKREMMSRYYDEVEMHSAELALKYGIEEGEIKLVDGEISGNTYRARLAIKKYFNAKWDADKKCWKVTENMDFANLIFAEGLAV